MGVVHEAAATGFSRDTDRYHRSRPSYHPELSKRVAERYGKGVMVELGAGTGIFTRQLVDEGLEVIALEPVIAMRTALSEAVPEADVRVGSAEKIPMADNTVDTIVAAQAFHWFEVEPALAEIYRVLVPGGHLVTAWNVRDNSVPWMADYDKVMERHAGSTPRYRSMAWRKAIHADDRFAPIDEWRMANPFATTVDGVVERALSTSFISALPSETMAKVADEIRAIVEPHGPEVSFPYESQMQSWRKGGR